MQYSSMLWISTICQQGIDRNILEDSLYIRNIDIERYAILCIADGVGGNKNGEIASSEVCRAFDKPIENDPSYEILQTIQRVNSNLYHSPKNMGTTTVSILVLDKKTRSYYVASVGDCKIYKYGNSKLQLISKTDEDTYNSEQGKGLIIDSIGHTPIIDKITTNFGEFYTGNSFILLSDGIHSTISRDIIRETIQTTNKNSITTELTNLAINRGSKDDMSAIFVLCSEAII